MVTLLLSNVIVNETLPIVMDDVLGGGGVTAILASTVLIVVFGEIIPQSVCSRYGLAIGAFFAWYEFILRKDFMIMFCLLKKKLFYFIIRPVRILIWLTVGL